MGRPLSARRKMMALRELGAILKLARRLDHVAKDLMFYVDKTFSDEGAIKDAPGEKLSPFSADEVRRILESASEGDPSGWERRLLEVLFFTGMRCVMVDPRGGVRARASSSSTETYIQVITNRSGGERAAAKGFAQNGGGPTISQP